LEDLGLLLVTALLLLLQTYHYCWVCLQVLPLHQLLSGRSAALQL
jgi:hypothetical protein